MNSTALCTAASLELNSITAYPPTTSFASVNGPSITASFPPESRTRELIAVGAKPPLDKFAFFCLLRGQPSDRFHQLLRRGCDVFGRFHHHHESHCCISCWF